MTSLDLQPPPRRNLAAEVIAALCWTPFVCTCGLQVTGNVDDDLLQCAACGWEERCHIEIYGGEFFTGDDPPLHLSPGDSVCMTTSDQKGKFLYHHAG